MQNENRCRHLLIRENLAVYRRGGRMGDAASYGAQRYLFVCKLGGKKSKRSCPYQLNRAEECPDYKT